MPPPPPPPGTPTSPPPFGAPGAPPGTTHGAIPGTAPAANAKPHRRPPWVLPAAIGIVVVAAVVVGVVVLSGDDGPPAIDAAAVSAVVDDFDRELRGDRDDAGDDGMYVELDECPGGDLDDLWALAPDGVEPIDRFDSGQTALTFGIGDDEPISYQCYETDDDGEGDPNDARVGGLLLGHAPGDDYESYIEDSLPDFDIEFREVERHRGGEVHAYCAEPTGENAEFLTPFCNADWVGVDVMVGVFVTVDPDDVGLVRDWLVAALDTIVAAVLDSDGELERAGS